MVAGSDSVPASNAKLLRQFRQARDDLNAAAKVAPTSLEAMVDAQNGWPKARSFDRDRVSGAGHADPTADLGLTRDKAADDLKRAEALMLSIIANWAEMRRILDRYGPP